MFGIWFYECTCEFAQFIYQNHLDVSTMNEWRDLCSMYSNGGEL